MNRMIVVAVMFASACAGGPGGMAAQLDGRAFRAKTVSDRSIVSDKIRMSFSATRLDASGGCNDMSGSYTIESGRLHVSELRITEMGCMGGNHDAWLGAVLESRPRIALKGSDLTLSTDGVQIQLGERE